MYTTFWYKYLARGELFVEIGTRWWSITDETDQTEETRRDNSFIIWSVGSWWLDAFLGNLTRGMGSLGGRWTSLPARASWLPPPVLLQFRKYFVSQLSYFLIRQVHGKLLKLLSSSSAMVLLPFSQSSLRIAPQEHYSISEQSCSSIVWSC